MKNPNNSRKTTGTSPIGGEAGQASAAGAATAHVQEGATDLLAGVRSRIDLLAGRRSELQDQIQRAKDCVMELWRTPLPPEEMADLTVRLTVDALADSFQELAGIPKVFKSIAEPAGWRSNSQFEGSGVSRPVDHVRSAFSRNNALAETTGIKFCLADAVSLERNGAASFGRMTHLPPGAVLGFKGSDEGGAPQGVIFAAALALFGGALVRDQVHKWALDFFTVQAATAASEGSRTFNKEELLGQVEAGQQQLASLEDELTAVEDELADLPVLDFNDFGEMTCDAQRAARQKKGLQPVYGIKKR